MWLIGKSVCERGTHTDGRKSTECLLVGVLKHSTSAGMSNGSDNLFDSANQTAYESIQALRTVQSYNLQGRVVAIYNRLLAKPNKRSLFNAISSGAALGFGQGIMFWVYAFAFWYGGKLVDKREMSAESTLKVFFAILLATMGISQAQIAFPDVAKGSKAVSRVFRGELPLPAALAYLYCNLLSSLQYDPGAHCFKQAPPPLVLALL